MNHILKNKLLFTAAMLSIFVFSNTAIAASVAGRILDKNDKPVPGLTVYLVHRDLGRSVPARTKELGDFCFKKIPIKSTPYYIEVFWGKRIVHRGRVDVNREIVVVPDIKLK